MLSAQDRRESRLERLHSARIFFLVPAIVWGVVTLLDVVSQVFGLPTNSDAAKVISSLARWTFVLALIWCALAAFFTSYRVLERIAGRNLLAFVLVQGIAYYLFR